MLLNYILFIQKKYKDKQRPGWGRGCLETHVRCFLNLGRKGKRRSKKVDRNTLHENQIIIDASTLG
jgi:hypothetical protein